MIRVLDELVAVHGRPSAIRVDNGPEFTAQTFVDWCAEHGVAIHYIQPGKPDQNAYIERFNRSYRTEVLNAHLFESLAELRALTDTWLRIYNSERPHDSLGRVPPLTFLAEASSAGQSPWNVYLTGKLTSPPPAGGLTLELTQKAARQQSDVVASLAQQRNANVEDVQTVVEIETELPAVDCILQVAIGRGDDAHVDAEPAACHPAAGIHDPGARAGIWPARPASSP